MRIHAPSSIKSWIRHWLDPHWHCSAFIALLKKSPGPGFLEKISPRLVKKKFPPPAWWKKKSLPLPDEKKNSLPLSGGKKNSLPSGKNHSPPIDINWYVPKVDSVFVASLIVVSHWMYAHILISPFLIRSRSFNIPQSESWLYKLDKTVTLDVAILIGQYICRTCKSSSLNQIEIHNRFKMFSNQTGNLACSKSLNKMNMDKTSFGQNYVCACSIHHNTIGRKQNWI